MLKGIIALENASDSFSESDFSNAQSHCTYLLTSE